LDLLTKPQQIQASFVVHRPVAQRALRMQRPAPADQDSPASSSAGFDPAQLQYRTSQAHQSSSKTHPPATSSFAASAADTAAAMSISLRQTSDELQNHGSQVQGHIEYIMHMVLSHQWCVILRYRFSHASACDARVLGRYMPAVHCRICLLPSDPCPTSQFQ